MNKQLDKLHDHCISMCQMLERLPSLARNDFLKGYIAAMDEIAGLTVEIEIEQQEEEKL